jgi:hypothetical protein
MLNKYTTSWLVAPLDSQPIKLEATIAALPSQEELVMLVELLR